VLRKEVLSVGEEWEEEESTECWGGMGGGRELDATKNGNEPVRAQDDWNTPQKRPACEQGLLFGGRKACCLRHPSLQAFELQGNRKIHSFAGFTLFSDFGRPLFLDPGFFATGGSDRSDSLNSG
jgi:hypothetical protein